MVAARPDASNPFLTRKARLRRAKFILERGEPQPLSLEGVEQAPVTQSAYAPAAQTTYSFGKGWPSPRGGFKPAST